MNNPLISVIIPIYKVEKYLRECVDSVLGQTYRNLEIILVDDGSPDGCPAICDEYAARDPRIRVIHKPNGGLSDARNAGIDIMTGDYCIFLDSDDYWIGKDFLNKFVAKALLYDADVVFGDTIAFFEDTGKSRKMTPYLDEKMIDGKEIEKVYEYLNGDNKDMRNSACMRMTKSRLIKDNNLFFEKGLISEDIDWTFKVAFFAKRFAALSEPFYMYRRRACSITTSLNIKSINGLFWIIETWQPRLMESNLPETVKEIFLSYIAYQYCIVLAFMQDFKGQQRRYIKNKLKELKFLLRYDANLKVKMVKKVKLFMGTELTSKLLKGYINYRYRNE